MPSPFPGMNPYLEQDDVWRDFRRRLLAAAAEAIGNQVRPDYLVQIRERLGSHEVERESVIEIRDRPSRELVCRIEVLSPWNKRPGPCRDQYLAERRRVLTSPAHLVEIDLLRGSEPMPSE